MFFKYNNNNKIFYEKYGNKKKTIIILPGWGDNRRTFNSIIKSLKDNYTIYIFDYPGFGNSPTPDTDLTIYDYSKIIISFINKMKIKNPILIGHSFGGRIIITLNGYYKIPIKKIVLISSAGIINKRTKKQKIRQIIYKLLKKIGFILPSNIKKRYLDKLIKIFGSNDYKNLNESLRKTFINIVREDLSKYLRNIASNTLLIWGENDSSTPINDAYTMNNLIQKSKLITLENCNHFCYIEKKDIVIKLISDFINEN